MGGEQILEGKNALVTGGGTGIGRGIAQALLESGARVTLAARRVDVPSETVQAFEEAGFSGRVSSVACDVTLAQHEIRVHAVAPGFDPVNELMDPVREGYQAITPAGRAGTPADIAEAVLYFASDRIAWTTGQVLGVDGGISVPLMLDMGPLAKGLFGEEAIEQFGVKDFRSVPKKTD